MKHAEGNPEDLKKKFWKSLADSPFLFLQLTNDSSTAVPMSPQLDKDANSSSWVPPPRPSKERATTCSPASTACW